MGDAYFNTEKRGEIFELRKALHDNGKSKKRDALKKVVAALTVGKDVSSLFPDVVNCMQTTNIEVKKLVYLYVINYARAQPELAILAVNTFRKDSLDSNPLIRGLAIRTMGCIRLDQITEYLVEPLRRCCKDSDPYARKTAAMCIAKLYDVSPQMVDDQGFLDILREMLGDSNPMVVANSVAALSEISEISGQQYLKDLINSSEQSVSKLLAALNECTEWGQVFLLDALTLYEPTTPSDAESMLERVTARLSHANAAVVLSATKVVMKLLNVLSDEDVIRNVQRKLSPPLVTLLSSEPEIQYVALRNINLIVQKYPSILAADVKMFFCKYNDPVYVKMEKIDIMVRLTNERNIDQVLLEFKEYATEVDVDFVRTAVRAIGRSAIKIVDAAEKCISVLLDLIESRVNYVVQEAIVVIKDIFRKYPNRYESIISSLCENLDSLDEPEAKASMIWIIGEYAERIDNADELLDVFMDSFHDESPSVQLQILSASVKLFLKRPSSAQELVTRVLKMATDECNNPDVRDRAYIYWRLLSRNPQAARDVILCEKPTITDDAYSLDAKLLDKLIENISMLASIYHKSPDSFALVYRNHASRDLEESDYDSEADDEEVVERAKQQMEGMEEGGSEEEVEEAEEAEEQNSSEEDEDKEIFDTEEADENSNLPPEDLKMVVVLRFDKPGSKKATGLQVEAGVNRKADKITAYFQIENYSPDTINGFQLMFNNNAFGLDIDAPFALDEIASGESTNVAVPLTPNRKLSGTPPSEPLVLQTAIKCSLDVFYFTIPFDLSIVMQAQSPMNPEDFRSVWQSLNSAEEPKKKFSFQARAENPKSADELVKEMEVLDYNLVANREESSHYALYFSGLTTNEIAILVEVLLQKNGPAVKVSIGTASPGILRPAAASLVKNLGLSVAKK